MLPSVIKGARIWVFNYNLNYLHNAQTVQVNGLAVTLLNYIKDRCNDFELRKIVFIRSCFSSIVVAKMRISNVSYSYICCTPNTANQCSRVKTQALLTTSRKVEDKRKKAVFNQTTSVIFLGSPLQGTKAATFTDQKNFVFGILDPT